MNIDKRQRKLAYQRNWNKTVQKKKMEDNDYRMKVNENHKKYRQSEKGKIVQNRKHNRMYLKHHEKHLARSRLRYAVKTGKIEKLPCVICGNIKSQGHHEDYTKPLEVIWLCDLHHKMVEDKLKLKI